MILGSDDFNRTTGTLGAGWTEHGVTNMSCDGSHARVDASGQAHLATLSGTSQRDTYLQCWMLGPGTAPNTVGLIWRFQDTSNYYLLRYATSWGVFRVEGGAANPIGGTFAGDPATIPKRMGVRHVGTRIQVYVDNLYDTGGIGREGPLFDETDADAQGSAWIGPCGLSCSASNATAITNVKWNDFIVFDGGPQTIYVDTAFNGGAVGEGMGTADRPDLTLQHALNNVGLNVQGKIKLQSTGIEANGATPKFSIGHGGKFGRSAYSFPTYDDSNGKVISAGDPNLTIEGRDGGRSVLRENAGSQLFNMRDDAKGILYRGLDFEATGAVSSAAIRTAGNAGEDAGDHSFAVHKCRFDLNTSADAIDRVVQLFGAQTRVEILYNYIRVNTTGVNTFLAGSVAADAVQNLRVRMNVFDYRLFALPNTGDIGVIVGRAAAAGVRVGDSWDIDHNTFIEVRSAGADDCALGLWDAADVDGDVEFQNNIVFGQSVGEPTGFGIKIPAGTITGTVRAHHNGYFRVTTPRSAQVTNQGNEVDATDPVFTNPSTGTVFAWQHTAGQGLLGEGTFAAIAIEGDFRPTDPAYVDSADDSDLLLGVLDRGALQSFFVAAVVPGSSLPPVEQARIFCPSVIFDPGGPQQYDLSAHVLQMTPVRYERDILLRSYRANDVSIQFNDKDGLFLESNPNSFLLDSDGNPDWLGKPVIVTAIYNGDQIHRFRGFVLEVKALPGTGILQIGNRFQQLFDRHVLANDIVRIVATNNTAIHPRTMTSVATAGYIARGNIALHLDVKPTVETLTFDFQDAIRFIVTGSVSGYEGEGTITSNFTTLSGSITVAGGDSPVVHSGTARSGGSNTIQLALTASGIADFYNGMTITLTGGTGAGQQRTIIDYETGFVLNRLATVDSPWATVPDDTTPYIITTGTAAWNAGIHTYAEGEKVTVTLGWASVELSNPPENDPQERIVDIYRTFLLSDQAGMLESSDLDEASIAMIEGGRANQMARPFVVDRPERVIEALDDLSLHMGCVTIEKSNATLGLASVMPRTVPAGSLDQLCSGDDLMEAETEHLPIYNQFVSVFDYDVATANFQDGVNFPVRKSDNPSQVRYDRLFPAPRALEFRSFSDEIADNGSWVTLILEVLYRRYENPTLVIKAKAKVRRLAAELDDLYTVDSEVPTTHVDAMEPFGIDKLLAAELTASLELVDVSAIVKEEGECGYLSYDTPGEGYDQCWGYF